MFGFSRKPSCGGGGPAAAGRRAVRGTRNRASHRGALAAEAEFFGARIADRPFAGLVGEMEDGDAAALRQVDEAHRLRLRQRCWRGWTSARIIGFRAVPPAVGMLGMPLRRPAGRLGSRCLRGARGCAARCCCARPERLRRCTLPITALRVTPDPSRPAIWLALSPSVQSFFRSSTRSSVQDNFAPPRLISSSSLNGIPHASPGRLVPGAIHLPN